MEPFTKEVTITEDKFNQNESKMVLAVTKRKKSFRELFLAYENSVKFMEKVVEYAIKRLPEVI